MDIVWAHHPRHLAAEQVVVLALARDASVRGHVLAWLGHTRNAGGKISALRAHSPHVLDVAGTYGTAQPGALVRELRRALQPVQTLQHGWLVLTASAAQDLARRFAAGAPGVCAPRPRGRPRKAPALGVELIRAEAEAVAARAGQADSGHALDACLSMLRRLSGQAAQTILADLDSHSPTPTRSRRSR